MLKFTIRMACSGLGWWIGSQLLGNFAENWAWRCQLPLTWSTSPPSNLLENFFLQTDPVGMRGGTTSTGFLLCCRPSTDNGSCIATDFAL